MKREELVPVEKAVGGYDMLTWSDDGVMVRDVHDYGHEPHRMDVRGDGALHAQINIPP